MLLLSINLDDIDDFPKYKPLFDLKRWEQLKDLFEKEAFKLHSLTQHP